MYRDVLCFTCYLLYKHTKHSIVISPPNTKLIDKESSPGKRKKKPTSSLNVDRCHPTGPPGTDFFNLHASWQLINVEPASVRISLLFCSTIHYLTAFRGFSKSEIFTVNLSCTTDKRLPIDGMGTHFFLMCLALCKFPSRVSPVATLVRANECKCLAINAEDIGSHFTH